MLLKLYLIIATNSTIFLNSKANTKFSPGIFYLMNWIVGISLFLFCQWRMIHQNVLCKQYIENFLVWNYKPAGNMHQVFYPFLCTAISIVYLSFVWNDRKTSIEQLHTWFYHFFEFPDSWVLPNSCYKLIQY